MRLTRNVSLIAIPILTVLAALAWSDESAAQVG